MTILPSDFLFADPLSVKPDKCGPHPEGEVCEQRHGSGNMVSVPPPVL